VRCNGTDCGTTFAEGEEFSSVAEVRARARRDGWSTREARDYCPTCTQRRAARFHLQRYGRRFYRR
jgi:hypothetical protein